TYSIPSNYGYELAISTTSSSTSSQHCQVIAALRYQEASSQDPGSFSLNGNATHTAWTVGVQGQAATITVNHPVIESTATYQSNRTSNHNVSLPSGIQEDDLLVMVFRAGSNTSASTPSGWSLLASRTNQNGYSYIWYRTATGS